MTKIYLITNLVNGKQYVGKTKYSLAHRWLQHCNRNYNTYLHNAIVKYGKDNFKIEEICRCDDSHWEELEKFYIKEYHTHYTEGGYNVSWGGDSNPMDEPLAKQHHREKMGRVEQRQKDRETIIRYNMSDKRKQNDIATSVRQKGIYVKQFSSYNDSKKVKVGMMVDGKIIKTFDSIADACKYLGKPTKEAGHILKVCDVINKHGRPAKHFGYSWTRLEKE